jgi:tight adherence protein B
MIDFSRPDTLLLLGAAVAVFLVFSLVAFALAGSLGGRRMKRRVENVQARWKAGAPQAAYASMVRLSRSDSNVAGLDWLIKRALPRPERMRARLVATGQRISLGEYLLFVMVMIAAVTLVGHMLLAQALLPSALVGVAVGLWVPHSAVKMLVARRLRKFTSLFPEAIDLIVRGLKSGLPVSESIRTVGVEVPDPIGVEFRRVTDSVVLGKSLEEALWDAATRLDTPEFKFFIVALSIQRETGGNLAETLGNLADILRRRRQMRLKIRALSSEARASAYILGSLPFVVFGAIMIVNPGYAMQLFEDPRGHMIVAAGLSSLLLGVVVMAKMIKFEI